MVDVPVRRYGTRAGANAAIPSLVKPHVTGDRIKQGERYNEKSINERHRDHAMFIAYAPAENPKIALAVLVENTGTGATAAPIARKVFDILLGESPEATVAQLIEPSKTMFMNISRSLPDLRLIDCTAGMRFIFL